MAIVNTHDIPGAIVNTHDIPGGGLDGDCFAFQVWQMAGSSYNLENDTGPGSCALPRG